MVEIEKAGEEYRIRVNGITVSTTDTEVNAEALKRYWEGRENGNNRSE